MLCIAQGTTHNLLLRNFLISPEKREELDSEVLLRVQQQTPQNPYCGPQILSHWKQIQNRPYQRYMYHTDKVQIIYKLIMVIA